MKEKCQTSTVKFRGSRVKLQEPSTKHRGLRAKGQIEKYKAELVEKGYSQVEGINFDDIFSHVAKLDSIRVLVSLHTTFDIEIEQMDEKTTFLCGDLEEENYMKQIRDFVVEEKKEPVKLKKYL